MTLEVEVAGRLLTVTLEPGAASGGFRTRVAERTYDVRAARTSGDGLLVQRAVAADKPSGWTVPARSSAGPAEAELPPGRVSEIFVTPIGADVLVNLGGRTIAATVNGRRTGRAADLSRQTHGEARLVAPMPGRIVRVLVGPGDEVAVRQPLVVVEAMKMENELRAPRAGRVREISAVPGASVEAGRVLLVID